jgi:hypothetical protein
MKKEYVVPEMQVLFVDGPMVLMEPSELPPDITVIINDP